MPLHGPMKDVPYRRQTEQFQQFLLHQSKRARLPPRGPHQTCAFICACEHVHTREWLASLFPKHWSQRSELCQLKALHVFLQPAIEEHDNSRCNNNCSRSSPAEHRCDNRSLAFATTDVGILPCDVSVIPGEGSL